MPKHRAERSSIGCLGPGRANQGMERSGREEMLRVEEKVFCKGELPAGEAGFLIKRRTGRSGRGTGRLYH